MHKSTGTHRCFSPPFSRPGPRDVSGKGTTDLTRSRGFGIEDDRSVSESIPRAQQPFCRSPLWPQTFRQDKIRTSFLVGWGFSEPAAIPKYQWQKMRYNKGSQVHFFYASEFIHEIFKAFHHKCFKTSNKKLETIRIFAVQLAPGCSGGFDRCFPFDGSQD